MTQQQQKQQYSSYQLKDGIIKQQPQDQSSSGILTNSLQTLQTPPQSKFKAQNHQNILISTLPSPLSLLTQKNNAQQFNNATAKLQNQLSKIQASQPLTPGKLHSSPIHNKNGSKLMTFTLTPNARKEKSSKSLNHTPQFALDFKNQSIHNSVPINIEQQKEEISYYATKFDQRSDSFCRRQQGVKLMNLQKFIEVNNFMPVPPQKPPTAAATKAKPMVPNFNKAPFSAAMQLRAPGREQISNHHS